MIAPLSPADLPLSLRLAWWGTSWWRGHLVADTFLDGVLGHGLDGPDPDADAIHLVTGLGALGLGGPGSLTEGTEPLLTALGRLRAEGGTLLGAAFPEEGDPAGLGGPATFNSAALEAGEAVVCATAGVGLVPGRVGAAVTWTAYEARRRQIPDVGEADRAVRSALPAATDALADLDVARWRPEVADQVLDLRHRAALPAPAGVPERCADLASRALQLLGIVELALEDDGAAVTAAEMSARRDALRPLARAARHALTSAGSPEVWPEP
ncbi:hypothetical protein [Nocardioides insulae]|uniref:hypothetical protein n=1 Tax=Nocardioides insulae TaxID=394734 RepID=UPI0004138BAC|nr:hypothetical protein [Nocardioides insulae]